METTQIKMTKELKLYLVYIQDIVVIEFPKAQGVKPYVTHQLFKWLSIGIARTKFDNLLFYISTKGVFLNSKEESDEYIKELQDAAEITNNLNRLFK